ncbi:MAG TPA: hypothetical protein VFA93_02470 [Patescibacteria group bacterium]|nr:hypothetical protein [Patescibacteria group bacterium]
MSTKTLFILGAIILIGGAAYFLINGSSTGNNPLSQSEVSSSPSQDLQDLNSSDSDLNGMDSDLNSLQSESSSL